MIFTQKLPFELSINCIIDNYRFEFINFKSMSSGFSSSNIFQATQDNNSYNILRDLSTLGSHNNSPIDSICSQDLDMYRSWNIGSIDNFQDFYDSDVDILAQFDVIQSQATHSNESFSVPDSKVTRNEKFYESNLYKFLGLELIGFNNLGIFSHDAVNNIQFDARQIIYRQQFKKFLEDRFGGNTDLIIDKDGNSLVQTANSQIRISFDILEQDFMIFGKWNTTNENNPLY